MHSLVPFSTSRRLFLALSVLILLAAGSARAEEPKTFEVADFTFARPADWQWVPVSSPMRKAQLKVGAGPAGADVTFFYFSGPGGDPEANTKRWLAQFRSAPDAEKIEKKTYGPTKVTYVQTMGTFNSGMPGGPTTPLENQALFGAILEGAEGSVFVKMTGPSATVSAAHNRFEAFIAEAAKTRH